MLKSAKVCILSHESADGLIKRNLLYISDLSSYYMLQNHSISAPKLLLAAAVSAFVWTSGGGDVCFHGLRKEELVCRSSFLPHDGSSKSAKGLQRLIRELEKLAQARHGREPQRPSFCCSITGNSSIAKQALLHLQCPAGLIQREDGTGQGPRGSPQGLVNSLAYQPLSQLLTLGDKLVFTFSS